VTNRLNSSNDANGKELDEVTGPVQDAQRHAVEITQRVQFLEIHNSFYSVSYLQAKELDALLSDSRDISKNAIGAANAYKNIVDAIEKGLEAGREAGEVADDAIDKVCNCLKLLRNLKFYFHY